MVLKVLTWLWKQPGGRATYNDLHVRIWASMIRRHLTLPHTLAVVTDLPGDYGQDVEVIAPPGEFEELRLPTWKEARPQCLRRLSMFRRDAADIFGADRIVCTDLDLVVCGSLDPVLDIADDFKITRGTAIRRLYNGSMMSLRLGSRPQVYETFNLKKAIEAGYNHVGSDQSWIAHSLPGEKTWGPDDGVRFWSVHSMVDARVVFFAGQTKPWTIVGLGNAAEIAKHYRASVRKDRCLVLSYGPTLWDDVADAVNGEPFGGVIASPEAAPHWPGQVLALAHDDDHASRLATMHGFRDVVWCGRQERIGA